LDALGFMGGRNSTGHASSGRGGDTRKRRQKSLNFAKAAAGSATAVGFPTVD
jgi:hypothetical protein